MSDRREFLKQAGVLAAARWPKAGAAPLAGPTEPQARLRWEFSDGKLHVRLGDQRILQSLCPGYQERGEWKHSTNLTRGENQAAYSDRVGRGAATQILCKLGSLDGELRLVEYEDGKLGGRLSVTNRANSPAMLEPLSPLMTQSDGGTILLEGHPAEWRVYVDSGSCGGRCASYALNENQGKNSAGAVSVLWSPGGNQSLAIGQVEVERCWTSIVYEYGGVSTNTHAYRWAQTTKADLRIEQDCTGYRLDPGEMFSLDLCALIFDADPFRSLIVFRDAMVAFNQVRTFTNRDVCVGWMTWYNQETHLRGGGGAAGDTAATEAITVEQSRYIANTDLRAYGVQVIAIDEGYQRRLQLGDWLETTPAFPGGMKGVAETIRQLGLKPGVWLAPFLATEDSPVYKEHPDWFVRYSFDWYFENPPVRAFEFDSTAPGAMDWLLNIFRTFQGWGFWFFKNDFSGGLFSSHGKQYHNQKQTGLMRWRWTWRKIKEALGGDGACSIQFCGANNVGGIGIVDTVRTGSDIGPGVSDNQWKTIREDTATTGINRWWQNKHFFISDPDNLEVAEYPHYRLYVDKIDYDYKMAMTWDEARVRAALAVAVGGNIFLGDRLTLLEPGKIDIIKKTLPVYGESAVPLDMFEQTIPCLWWHHLSKPWGTWEVLSVVNFGETSLVKEVPLSRMGLRGDQNLIAWEFWEQVQHGDIENGLLRAVVKPHSVKTFRLTPVERDRCALVGSSFHFTMGGVEVNTLTAAAGGSLRVQLRRPAMEKGKCSFWSAQKQAVVELPVAAGPQGADLSVS